MSSRTKWSDAERWIERHLAHGFWPEEEVRRVERLLVKRDARNRRLGIALAALIVEDLALGQSGDELEVFAWAQREIEKKAGPAAMRAARRAR